MNSVSEPFNQEVLFDNEQIFQRLSAELKNARSQILVATAWFTDPDLLQHLLEAAARGVNVRVIMAENDDNKKLDFEALQKLGAAVYKVVRQSGYRGMRKRFCIVDQRTAIYGSYYWTINARLNNQESVIVTNHTDTVNSLISQFSEMEELAIATDGETELKAPARSPEVSVKNEAEGLSPSIPDALNFQASYANVLDRMIAAEVCNFDRGLLRQQGYDRAEASHGDAQMLSNAMDTVYSVFINDINIVEDKKKRLIGKIHEQKIMHGGMLENNYQAQLRTIETQTETSHQETTARISNLKVKADVYKLDIAAIKDQKVAAAELTGKEIEAHIHALERDSISPRFKWYEFIPVSFLSLGLLFYLVLFYSSAVYILLFSETDARSAQLNGLTIEPPQVFEPHALSKILERGNYALGFVCLFVFLPLAVSVIGKLAKESIFSKFWVMLLFTFLLDGFIAYTVAAAVHEAAYLAGTAATPWHFSMAFTEPNFYLVFVLGSLGLLIFNALFNKLLRLFEERNPDVQALQLKLRKEQEKEALNKNRAQVAELKETADTFSKELIQVNNDIHLLEMEMAGLPHKKALAIEKCASDFENSKKLLNDITAVYIAHIENDILPISIDSMKDRINVFLEGWTGFLHREYAEARAIEKATQALEAAAVWQQEKLAGNRIDNRIKAL